MDDTGSGPNAPEATAEPAAEPAAPPAAPMPAAHAPKMVHARSVPTSTLVLGTILLLVAGFLGGWIVGHHAARRADRIAFASFMRNHEGGFGSGYGPGFGGYRPGCVVVPGYPSSSGSWCSPCAGTNAGVAIPCVGPVPGYAPGTMVPGQPMPTAVPGSGGSQGSTGSQGSGS